MTARHRPKHADDGATLIIVLILITVLSTVMGVILSQEDTAVRSTDMLRDQAADNYSADGATQAMLNMLKTSGINCTDPANPDGKTFGSTSNPFYSPASGPQGAINAYAQCTPDPVRGAATSTSTPPAVTTVNSVTPAPTTSTGAAFGSADPTLPTYGLLTTGNTSADYGIDFSLSSSNKTICVQNGSVASSKNIDLYGAQQRSGITLAVRLAPDSTQTPPQPGTTTDCTTGSGKSAQNGSQLLVTAQSQCIKGPTGVFAPTDCTPGIAAPSAPSAPALSMPAVTDNPVPVCSTVGQTTYAAFVPGRYTDVRRLNIPCTNPGSTLFVWLSPGTYYFDFGSTAWSWPDKLLGGTPMDSSGTVIAGLRPTDASTLSNLSRVATQSSDLTPTSCADPINSGVSGVALVFGGASRTAANSSGSVDLCASSPTTSPPVVIDGLASDLSILKTDGTRVTVPAQTLCVPTCGSTSLIATEPNGQPTLYFKGYVYAPNAQLALTLKNSPGQVFNWGVVVRDFGLGVNGTSPTTPFISLPKPSTGVSPLITTTTPSPYTTTSVSQPPPVVSTTYSIRYVNVWTCTVAALQSSGQSRCPSAGPPNVQVRVLTNGSTMSVLSWNTLH